MGLMKNKAALVTGAAAGIGQASALALAREGAALCIADLNRVAGEETAQRIVSEGGEAIFVRGDVTRAADVQQMVKTAIDAFGRLDAAVNNAGIIGALNQRIHQTDDEMFDRVIAINLKGLWLCMKAELPPMLAQGQGAIVNIASVAGLVGAPKAAAYAASKHGVIGLTKSAALEYAKAGIRVNAVCPAYTDTAMARQAIDSNPAMRDIMTRAIPMKRLGQPTEIAEAVVWLCSDAASFITGHQLVVDGGLTAI